MGEFDPPPSARSIVKAAGSNLAFALAILPKERREDMRIFYAFCRVVDDIVDDPGGSTEEKRRLLDRWRELVLLSPGTTHEVSPRVGLEEEMVGLCSRRSLPVESLVEIIDGVAMDLDRNRFATFEDLKVYCHGVACAVGLVSIEIFGYEDPRTREYAEQLGYALQLTNIIRDVGEDAGEGRIYLPGEDLERFGVSESAILDRRHDEPFQRLVTFEAERAADFFEAAVAILPECDRASMKSAESMRLIYHRLLLRMQEGGFQVLEKRYRLSKLEKVACLFQACFGSR